MIEMGCSCGAAVFGAGVIDANFHCLGSGDSIEVAMDYIEQAGKRSREDRSPET